MALVARNVAAEVGGTPLLGGVEVQIEPGSVTAVLGPNGAGKTSLVRALTGDLPVSAGTISLCGTPLHEWSSQPLARCMAVLPQHSLLNFPFTAQEVVMLGRTPHDTGRARDRQIVDEALACVDGAYLAHRFYTHMSGGEKQRVHLARVLAQIWEAVDDTPRFLVLDEPTSSFDLAHQRLTLEVVSNFARRGAGVLIVLHDLNLAARCADSILLMQCGSVVHSGSPAEVLTQEIIQGVFQIDAHVAVHPDTGGPLVIT